VRNFLTSCLYKIAASGVVGFILSTTLAIGSTKAAIIYDQSPILAGIIAAEGGNAAAGFNHADQASFTSAATVTGMDIYSSADTGFVSTTIRIFNDLGGLPGTLVVPEFTEIISVIDTAGLPIGSSLTRKHVDFTTAVLLDANTTYWFSMTGTNSDLGLALYGASTIADGEHFNRFGSGVWTPSFSDTAFRLSGTLAAIPEPGTLAILGLGLVGLGFARRPNAA
jgi:hypothetical protein